jgi:hypothetical protein
MDTGLPGVRLRPAPSRQMARFLVALHLMVGTAILAAPVAGVVKLPLLLLLTLHGGWSKARFSGSVTQVQLERDGSAYLERGEGKAFRASLRRDTLITPWVILLRFDLLSRRRPLGVLICPDAISPGEMRRLRTLLRIAVLSSEERNS